MQNQLLKQPGDLSIFVSEVYRRSLVILTNRSEFKNRSVQSHKVMPVLRLNVIDSGAIIIRPNHASHTSHASHASHHSRHR